MCIRTSVEMYEECRHESKCTDMNDFVTWSNVGRIR